MTENTELAQAVQERMAQRRDADRPVTRFGRSGQRKVPAGMRRAPMPDASRAVPEPAWRRFGRSPAL